VDDQAAGGIVEGNGWNAWQAAEGAEPADRICTEIGEGKRGAEAVTLPGVAGRFPAGRPSNAGHTGVVT
jgi:hypothetical protein